MTFEFVTILFGFFFFHLQSAVDSQNFCIVERGQARCFSFGDFCLFFLIDSYSKSQVVFPL